MTGLYGDQSLPAADSPVRCYSCNKMLAELVTRPWSIRCPRCKSVNSGELTQQHENDLRSSELI